MTAVKRIDREEGRAYWMMVLPAFIIYLLVMAFPIVLSVALSVSNYSGGKMFGGEAWGFVGLKHYARVVVDPAFWNALKNNAYIVGISVFGQLPLGFVFAYIIYRKLVKWPDFWQGVLYVPNIISIIVVGLLWQVIFSPHGPIGDIMNRMHRKEFLQAVTAIFSQAGAPAGGFVVSDDVVSRLLALIGPDAASFYTDPKADLLAFLQGFKPGELQPMLDQMANLFVQPWSPDFLNKPDVAMLPVLFVILWMYTGMYLILFLANMQKIDSQVIESARIDGAHEGQVMRYIILPSLSGTIVNSAILAISGSLSTFALIFSMTGGGPGKVTEILSIFMYKSAFQGRPNFPLANAIALIMVLISFLLIILTKAIEKRVGGKEE